jgi:hypothetical protein
MITQTTPLDPQVVQQLNSLQSYRNSLISTFGQIYVRRQDLEKEFDKIQELQLEADEAYAKNNEEINSILDSLKETYQNGSIDLTSGTITYQVNEETTETNE